MFFMRIRFHFLTSLRIRKGGCYLSSPFATTTVVDAPTSKLGESILKKFLRVIHTPHLLVSQWPWVQRKQRESGTTAANRAEKCDITKGTLADTRIRLGAFQFCVGVYSKAASIWRNIRIPANVLWYIKYELQLILISAAHRIVCYSKLSFWSMAFCPASIPCVMDASCPGIYSYPSSSNLPKYDL